MSYRKKHHLRVQYEQDPENITTKDEGDIAVSCKSKLASRVFSEDYQNFSKTILDPQSLAACKWNTIFLAVSLLSTFIDPLFLYSPYHTAALCVKPSELTLDLVLTVLRSVLDVFNLINVVLHFRTAYVAPSSRVLGRGELVIDPWKIALRYLARDFWIDMLAVLPIPQVIVWVVIPNLKDSATSRSKTGPRFFILLQFLLRLILIYPLSSKISKATGAMPKRAWIGAAYNMLLYYLLSNLAGACYYLMGLQRQETCWRSECNAENRTCDYMFLDCSSISNPKRTTWLGSTNITNICDATNSFYDFGIYKPALQVGATSAPFLRKYFYCFWWALQNFGAIWNALNASSNVVENIFTSLFTVVAIILFALLIGNIQTYIESSTKRLDEWRTKRLDTERWMHHRQLDPHLRHSVRNYDQYKWVATRGVDEEALLRDLPANLKLKVNRHLWFNLLRQVPLLEQMDDEVLDVICERLKPSLFIRGAVLLREDEPVSRMFFIIHGSLESYITSGGQRGFFNSSCVGPGNFCGEELLTWALDHHSTMILPASTRTVKAKSKVEALALMPEDLKYVASQFRKLRSREVVHNFRFHSEQWRTWAACYIQAVWKRYKRRKELLLLLSSSQQRSVQDERSMNEEMEIFLPQPGSGLATYAAEVVRRIRMGSSNRFGPDSWTISSMDDYSIYGIR